MSTGTRKGKGTDGSDRDRDRPWEHQSIPMQESIHVPYMHPRAQGGFQSAFTQMTALNRCSLSL
jgi:hypothetical protein